LYNNTTTSIVTNNNQCFGWRRILYIDNFSPFSTIKFPSEIKPAYYTNNTLGQLLINCKDKENYLSHSGIYKLKCNDCPSFYIGKTTRNVNVRVKEHMRCLNNVGFSEFAEHLINTNHSFDYTTGINVLHINGLGIRLNNLEALEIKKSVKINVDHLLNNQKQLSFSPILDIFPLTS